MNVSKPLTIAASVLITGGSFAGIRAYANASVRSVPPPASVAVQVIPTLSTITVRPTRAQLDAVFGHGVKGTQSAAAGGADIAMPYYSFAVQPAYIGKD